MNRIVISPFSSPYRMVCHTPDAILQVYTPSPCVLDFTSLFVSMNLKKKKSLTKLFQPSPLMYLKSLFVKYWTDPQRAPQVSRPPLLKGDAITQWNRSDGTCGPFLRLYKCHPHTPLYCRRCLFLLVGAIDAVLPLSKLRWQSTNKRRRKKSQSFCIDDCGAIQRVVIDFKRSDWQNSRVRTHTCTHERTRAHTRMHKHTRIQITQQIWLRSKQTRLILKYSKKKKKKCI